MRIKAKIDIVKGRDIKNRAKNVSVVFEEREICKTGI